VRVQLQQTKDFNRYLRSMGSDWRSSAVQTVKLCPFSCFSRVLAPFRLHSSGKCRGSVRRVPSFGKLRLFLHLLEVTITSMF